MFECGVFDFGELNYCLPKNFELSDIKFFCGWIALGREFFCEFFVVIEDTLPLKETRG